MRLVSFACISLAAVIVSSPAARADEIKLKDGTKIVGTIVGFEENSFKVKTSYGFAVVQKDQVVSISISDAAKKPDAEKKPEPAAEKPAPPAKQVNSYKNYKTNPPAADPAPAGPGASAAPSGAGTAQPPAPAVAATPVK